MVLVQKNLHAFSVRVEVVFSLEESVGVQDRLSDCNHLRRVVRLHTLTHMYLFTVEIFVPLHQLAE